LPIPDLFVSVYICAHAFFASGFSLLFLPSTRIDCCCCCIIFTPSVCVCVERGFELERIFNQKKRKRENNFKGAGFFFILFFFYYFIL
jgi:hypothetical protein